MAILSNGILGGFSGKVGNVVGGNWKGIDYIRVKTTPTNPKSDKQVAQRTKFTTALSFLQPITAFLRTGYKLFTAKQTAFNAAMSQVLTNAIVVENDEISLDYSKIQVSAGTLTAALNGTFAYDNGEISISWDDNSGTGSASASDISMYVIYNPTKTEAVYSTEGVIRSVKTEAITLPSEWAGDTVYVYLTFITADGKDVANSAYLGSVEVVIA